MTQKQFSTPIADLLHIKRMLQMEYDHELNQFMGTPDMNGIARLIRRGDCWFPISLSGGKYNSLNRFQVDIFNENNENPDDDTNFEYGKPVSFFTITGNGTYKQLSCQAMVWRVDSTTNMKVVFPNAAALSELRSSAGQIGMRLYFDNASYKIMFNSINQVIGASGRLAELRNILKGTSEASFRNSLNVRLPWLNVSQQEAVNSVLAAKDVAIVHGPPGTGKTTTLVEAINETLQRETQVLVCAQSNMAVDWISEKLVDRGISVMRIGNPGRVNDKMLSFTYERRFEDHPDYPELWKIRKLLREREPGKRLDSGKREALKIRQAELEYRINETLFTEVRVISCTLIGAANAVLENRKFSTLFIDEAAQALEPACWVPIINSNRVILAGDHWQLPPTVKCYEAEKEGLAKTLMMKIAESKPNVASLLTTQYRMHRDIMQFSSEWFYNGQVKAAPEVEYRGILDFDNPLMWIDTSETGGDLFTEELVGQYGRINRGEAALIVEALFNYIEKLSIERILGEGIDIGVISPYRAQVRFLRHIISRDKRFKSVKRAITVHTVDGFQGQERDVIVISLVRANDDGNIGFLRDLRRMNVAITRARMKLIIAGNSLTLSKHPFYKALIDYCGEKGEVCSSQQFIQ